MGRSALSTWDGSSQVTAWALALTNAHGDIVGLRAFGEPLPAEVFYDAIALPSTNGAPVRDGLHAHTVGTPLPNAMSLVLALVKRTSSVSDTTLEHARRYLERIGMHNVADLLDLPSRAAIEQRELAPLRLWVFDATMRHTLASAAYGPEPPLYIVEAVRRFCADWDWKTVEKCRSGALSPVPNVLVLVTPLAGNEGFFAAANVQELKARSLESAIGEYSLTDREGDVLKLLLAGFRANEIAEALSIAESTVREHVKHVLVKTGSRNRAQMIARVLGYVPGVRHRLNNSLGMPN